jgi:hypothetical protein
MLDNKYTKFPICSLFQQQTGIFFSIVSIMGEILRFSNKEFYFYSRFFRFFLTSENFGTAKKAENSLTAATINISILPRPSLLNCLLTNRQRVFLILFPRIQARNL